MPIKPPTTHAQRRLAGLAATLALHLALLAWWQLSHKVRVAVDDPDSGRIQWLDVKPPRPVRTPAPAPVPVRQPVKATQARPATAASVAIPATPAEPAAAPLEIQAPPPGAADILQQARRDLGKISKELSKEFPGARIKAPVDSKQARLEKGFAEAYELAPPKWYEPAKITEIIDPGPYGRKRYRIVTAYGTYCATYESNHAPDGIDPMKGGAKPKLTNCPEHEQPATTQKW